MLAATQYKPDHPLMIGDALGDYQAELLSEFDRCLPSHPSWPVEE